MFPWGPNCFLFFHASAEISVLRSKGLRVKMESCYWESNQEGRRMVSVLLDICNHSCFPCHSNIYLHLTKWCYGPMYLREYRCCLLYNLIPLYFCLLLLFKSFWCPASTTSACFGDSLNFVHGPKTMRLIKISKLILTFCILFYCNDKLLQLSTGNSVLN